MFFLFLENFPFKTWQNFKKFSKEHFGCCKIQVVFKNQRNLSIVFCFNNQVPKDVMSCAVYKFQFGRSNPSYYSETDRNLKVMSRKHISIFPVTCKKIKPSVMSSIRNHLLSCNHVSSFDFTILTLRGLIRFY